MTPKALIVAGLVLAVFAVVVLTQRGNSQSPDLVAPPSSGRPSATAVIEDPGASATPTTEPSAAPTTDTGAARSEAAAEQMATAGILAYTQYSYRDPKPTSWIDRVGAISTDGFRHSLTEMFGGSTDDDGYWGNNVVPNRRETKTTVLNVAKTDFFEDTTKKRLTFTVTYETAMKTKDLDDWTDPPSAMSQFVIVVHEHDGWVVDDIRPTEDRSGA